MLRARMLLLLAGCFLVASAAWADDLGYVDCSSHPDGSPVYGKARQSQDIVGTVACGERFTVLLYGFIFSRVQTSDNKVGYVFSNLISIDRTPGAAVRPAEPRLVTSSKAPSNAAPPSMSNASQRAPVAREPKVDASVPPQAAPAQTTPVPAQAVSTQTVFPQPPPLEVNPTGSTSTPASSASQATAAAPDPTPASAAQPTPAEVTLNARAPEPEPASRAAEATPAAAQPNPPAPSQPEPPASQPTASQPAAAQPEATPAPARDTSVRSSWERPNPTGRRQSLVEVYGGYAFSRFDNGAGSFSNLNGFMGAFGVNVRSWIQIVGDSSYNFVTTNGVKSTLYGNHYGARFFYRRFGRWSASPFAEGMIGGTRLTTSVSGTGGYSTSDNSISYKFGGGVDMHPTRMIEIRVIDFDFYRTSFGTNLHQNNYWATAGIVLRLFGGRAE